ncbi:DEAD/DEAH box helicase [Paenibacillus motobuensis]|uniref:DEAD/DEAH box helicase n=1 Tax=Paenibacillus TaxID=44249 RepID=UPI00203B67AD|nr:MULTISPECIES: DEAD/DEAH box helicase [Paenibacillus]MCM3041842.1 DEAD/DEAH box helicase [Paenibacillus lutimineralis]MCM3648946.1 DEAD/DEAH box helicase [Paenibacillus motobuensis]
MSNTTFTGLGIGEKLAGKLADYGIQQPTPVQEECIPAALDGRDVLAQSQTGTGKTLAYLLPMLEKMTPDKTLQGLILAPTQELAMQIQREAEKYGEALGITVQALIGGAAIKRQLERLRLHPQLVVGTPGRIREIVEMKKLKLHTLRTVVVDEVDQMFKLGGTADVERILRGTLRDRQLMFLSATIDEHIRALAGREMKEPAFVGIEPEQRTSRSLEHLYFKCEERDKIDMLRRIVRHFNPERAIVFINNTTDIAEVEAKMNYVGLSAGALYGDADKTVRSVTLRRFREGKIRLLVASDVAARGLDVENLTLVINLDPPIDADHYVHRVGRTGRMGRSGLAVSLVSSKEEFIMRKFSRELGIEITPRNLYKGQIVEGDAHPEARSSASTGRQTTKGKSIDSARISESGQPRRPAKAKETSKTGNRPSKSAPAPARKKARDQDRKNKGAPKWLKDKQNNH